jgi:hypothetical protein
VPNLNPDQSSGGINIRSAHYLIARTTGTCTGCDLSTRLVALVVPPSHESLSPIGDDADGPHAPSWNEVSVGAFLFYVAYLPDDVRRHLLTDAYRPAWSSAVHGSYWANHCEHCGLLQEDHDLFCEPGGAFLPIDAASASAVELTRIDEPFISAAGGHAYEPEYLEHMTRI